MAGEVSESSADLQLAKACGIAFNESSSFYPGHR